MRVGLVQTWENGSGCRVIGSLIDYGYGVYEGLRVCSVKIINININIKI